TGLSGFAWSARATRSRIMRLLIIRDEPAPAESLLEPGERPAVEAVREGRNRFPAHSVLRPISFGAAQVGTEKHAGAGAAARRSDLRGELLPLDSVRRLVGDLDPERHELAPGPQDLVEVLADFAVHHVLPGVAVLARCAEPVHAAGDEDAVAEGQGDE